MGEASGYNGCRHSGIAFTSGKVIALNKLYEEIRDKLLFKGISSIKEYSTNIVYSLFNNHPKTFKQCVLFNCFPFHPHEFRIPESNRKPFSKEIKEGQEYIIKIIEIFASETIIAIGNVAFKSISNLIKEERISSNIQIHKVRHPSYGGKNDFLKEIKTILNLPLRNFKDITSFHKK
jgi:uracil-DNA glycosylase